MVLHMAAPCPPDVKRRWIDRVGAGTLWEVYGGTERLGVTVIGGSEWLDHPGSVGKASAGQTILILGESGDPLPHGQIGEIHFRKQGGVGTSYAYIGAETRIKGDVDSFGDMGWIDEQGYLYIADRRTDMILIGGVNIYPAEIEAVVEAVPEANACAAIGLPDDGDLGNRLHIIVELHADLPEPEPGDFLARLAARLRGLKCPRSVEFTRDRVRDDAGKLRRSQLREERIG